MTTIDLETRARALLRDAVRRHFPHIAVAATAAPEDLVLVDLLVRINPDVKILWFDEDWAGAELVKSRYYVTPIRPGVFAERALARRWNLHAIVTSARDSDEIERDRATGVTRVHPLTGWTDEDVQAYLRRHAVPTVTLAQTA